MAQAPGNSYPRRPKGTVADIIFGVEPEAVAEREVGPETPIIISEEPTVNAFDGGRKVARRDVELTGTVTPCLNLGHRQAVLQTLLSLLIVRQRIESESPVKAAIGRLAARQNEQCASEANQMLA